MQSVFAREAAKFGFKYAKLGIRFATSFNRLSQNELREYFSRNGSLIEYGSEKKVSVSTPDAYNEYIPEMDRMAGEYTISRPFVGVVEDARLIGAPPLAFLDGKFIEDASVSPNVQTLNIIKSARNVPNLVIRGNGKGRRLEEAVLLHNCWTQGYFHWAAETLTRLEGVENYTNETGRKPKLIVGPRLNPFQQSSLNALGYTQDDLINWECAYCTVDRLVVPSMRREIRPGLPSPIAHNWLRGKMRQKAMEEVDTSNFSSRVYISRNDAESRRVVNEDEVISLLNEYSFESYLLTKLQFEEVVALFAQADCIVAPHGAGLTDVIYTEDVAVVELHRDDRPNGVYSMLTQQADGWYGHLECQSIKFDIRVDIPELQKIVEAALNRRDAGKISV